MLVTLLVLIVALFVAADRIAVSYAQNTIASKIQTQANLSAKPSVSIAGFPFLTQVAAHDVRKVDISASNVVKNKVTISSITATATGVHLNSSFNGATIDQITGNALITYSALESSLAIPGGATISPDPSAGSNGVTVALAGGLASATGQVSLASPSQVVLKVDKLGGLAGLLGGGAGQPSYTLNIPPLPVGLTVTGISVTSQGVVLMAAAQHTSLSQ